MTVHSTLKTDDAQSVIEWLAPIPGLPATALFEEEGTPIHGASNADLRNLPARRNITSTKHNAVRLKIGKPAIPDLWRLDLSAGAESYTTPIHPRRKSDHKGRHAGMHASPIAHDRRGHRRRLRSGRTVWVRSCHVGTLIKHMTRKREFYRV